MTDLFECIKNKDYDKFRDRFMKKLKESVALKVDTKDKLYKIKQLREKQNKIKSLM